MMKYLPLLNLSLIIILAFAFHLNYNFSKDALEETKELKKEVEIYLDQKPDTIVVNINNYISKK